MKFAKNEVCVLDFSLSRFRNVWHLFGGISDKDKAYSEITCTAQKMNAKSHLFLIVSKAKLEGQYAFPELTLHKKHFLTINKKRFFLWKQSIEILVLHTVIRYENKNFLWRFYFLDSPMFLWQKILVYWLSTKSVSRLRQAPKIVG